MDRFNVFADWVAERVAHAFFFAFCVGAVLIWFPSIGIFQNVDTWQLVINTFTTIVTFLLMALLHNTQHRFEKAQNERWEALFEHLDISDPVEDEGQRE